ncbi:PilN domain-containing protein [Pedobacter sp.]|jgi:hypothetical protein|uniref:PilN domain-containing protein n=1 Tax=Pedobacter sp. TaxID=1411316 RepID=UPI002C78C6B4|nr:PilN domain-containing protein [Pedobacter sp.]HWW40108.1 PilN domain-containing protein [Pedobacter sp.]
MAFDFNFKSGLSSSKGLELKLQADGLIDVRLVELSLKGKMIQIGLKKQYTAELGQIADGLSGPLAITVTGRGVLIKKTKKLDEVREAALQQVFPGFNLTEFYVQNFISGEDSFLAVVRKDIVDKMIAAFKKKGVEVLMLGLGPFVVDQVLPQLNVYQDSLSFDGHRIKFREDKSWESYTQQLETDTGFALKIDLETMPEPFLLSYATAFQLILAEVLEPIEVDAPEIGENRAEYIAKLKFEKRGVLVLGLFFVLLLLNFLLFGFYNSSNQEMEGRAGRKSDLSANKKKMETEIKEKEVLVKKLGWNKGLGYAYICDQIGAGLPGSATLTEMSVESGLIKLKGTAENVYAINDCIYTFKKKSWVKDVQLEKYTADDQKQAQVFTITLNY